MSAAARGISCRCAWLPASLREPLPRADRLGVAVLAPPCLRAFNLSPRRPSVAPIAGHGAPAEPLGGARARRTRAAERALGAPALRSH